MDVINRRYCITQWLSLIHIYIAGNRRVIRFTGNFVDLIDVHDTALRFLYVVVTFLQQLLNDV